VVFLASFFIVHVTLRNGDLRRRLERSLTEFMCSIFVASWTVRSPALPPSTALQ
jgi:hypothetical protein